VDAVIGALVGVAIATASDAANDDVKWNKGSGPAQMAKGLPNPPGWYRAAVGPRSKDKVLYLTFDDGPSAYTASLLKALDSYDAKATFFVTGNAGMHKKQVRRMARAGHAIGNHTYNHLRLTQLSDAAIRDELRRTAKVVGPVMGACMRPPYGATNDRVKAVTTDEGYKSILWDFWAEDWNQPPIPQFLESLETATEDGSVILLHDGGGDRPNTVEAMRQMLPRWTKQGYTFQALPACTRPHTGNN